MCIRDRGLILFLLKIVKLSGGIYPAAGSCHMVYKSCCVRRNKVQLLWERKCRITAVSYTHLDVYKRQAWSAAKSADGVWKHDRIDSCWLRLGFPEEKEKIEEDNKNPRWSVWITGVCYIGKIRSSRYPTEVLQWILPQYPTGRNLVRRIPASSFRWYCQRSKNQNQREVPWWYRRG